MADHVTCEWPGCEAIAKTYHELRDHSWFWGCPGHLARVIEDDGEKLRTERERERRRRMDKGDQASLFGVDSALNQGTGLGNWKERKT